MEKLRIYWRHLSDPEGPGWGGEAGQQALESRNEGRVPGTAALAFTKGFRGGESEGKAEAVRPWLLQEAGVKAGLDVADFLRGTGSGTQWEGRGGSRARARLSAHLPPVKEGGKQSAQRAAYLRKVICESCRQSSPSQGSPFSPEPTCPSIHVSLYQPLAGRSQEGSAAWGTHRRQISEQQLGPLVSDAGR